MGHTHTCQDVLGHCYAVNLPRQGNGCKQEKNCHKWELVPTVTLCINIQNAFIVYITMFWYDMLPQHYEISISFSKHKCNNALKPNLRHIKTQVEWDCLAWA